MMVANDRDEWTLAIATGNGREDEIVDTYPTERAAVQAAKDAPNAALVVYRVWGPNGEWQEYMFLKEESQ